MQEATSPSGEQVELELGDQKVVVVGVGGGLRGYWLGDAPMLDGYGVDELCSSGRGQLLAPWPNRIQDGSYEFDGRTFQLALNEPERALQHTMSVNLGFGGSNAALVFSHHEN